MADVSSLKKVACDAIDAAADELHKVSEEIWENPELCFKEKHAHAVCIIILTVLCLKSHSVVIVLLYT